MTDQPIPPAGETLPGHATAAGTAAYAARFEAAAPGHFGVAHGLTLSSIGIGTYLGTPTPDYDARYRESVAMAVRLGANVIDSAINYRFQRSERSIAPALRDAVAAGIDRSELVVCSKAGFIPFDGGYPDNPHEWLRANIVDAGVAAADEIVGGMHCIAPGYLRHHLAQSRANLGVACVDVYHIHNPEAQLEAGVPRDGFMRRMRAAFEALEGAVSDGHIRHYGTATWAGYRCAPGSQAHLDLAALVALARDVAGDDHHFRFVQAPFNLAMPEAAVVPTQVLGGQPATLLHAALDLGVAVIGSASLLQARLAGPLPPVLADALPGFKDDAARALQFARSAPGLACALVGMSSADHVRRNLELVIRPPLSTEEFADVFVRVAGGLQTDAEDE